MSDAHYHEPHDHAGHAHVHAAPDTLGAKLLAGVFINLAIFVVQIVGGLLANSLGLLSDAAHNLSYVVSLLLSYGANRLGKQGPTPTRTFAYRRVEVLVAFFNAAALIAIAAFVAFEGVVRLLHPVEVGGPTVMLIAGIGMIANTAAAWLLKGHDDLNARSAFLHLVGDAAASGAVLVGGLFIWLAHLNRVDPVLSIAIAAWITWGAIKVIVEAGRILLEGVPVGLDVADVERAVLGVDGVAGVHDLHVWSVSSTDAVLSAHVHLADTQLSGTTPVIDRIKEALTTAFGIHHATLELECAGKECADGCCIYAPAPVSEQST